jgi:hypothetical protein
VSAEGESEAVSAVSQMRLSRPLTSKRLLQLAACAAGAFALIVFIYVCSLDSKPDRFDGAKLMNALDAYSREVKARSEKLPSSVTLDELVRRGFLQEKDVRAFAGMKAVISLDASETEPQSILMELTHPDGTKTVVQGDGSVQQETTARTRDRLKRLIGAQPKTPLSPPLPE